jgi:hypothetical protein
VALRYFACACCTETETEIKIETLASVLKAEREEAKTMTTKAKKTTKAAGKIPVPVRNGRGQLLIALRTMTLNGKRYPCGAVIDPNKLSQQHMAAMLNSRMARWEQRGDKPYPEPVELPKAEPVKGRPAIQIVEDMSAEVSWRLTLAANARVYGNEAIAMDELMSSPLARDLYKRACLEATQKAAKQRGLVSVCPTDLGL